MSQTHDSVGAPGARDESIEDYLERTDDGSRTGEGLPTYKLFIAWATDRLMEKPPEARGAFLTNTIVVESRHFLRQKGRYLDSMFESELSAAVLEEMGRRLDGATKDAEAAHETIRTLQGHYKDAVGLAGQGNVEL